MKHKDILMIVIPSFILIIIWVIFSIYHNSVSSTISPALGIQIKSITPEFDMVTLYNLKRRNKVQPIYQITIPESPTPTPISSPSSSLFPNEETINDQGGNQQL